MEIVSPLPRIRLRLLAAATTALVAAACSSALVTDPGGVTGAELGPPMLEIAVLAGDDLSVVPAEVTVDGVRVAMGAAGTGIVPWPGRAIIIDVAADGFRPWSQELADLPEAGRIEFRLDPVVLVGRLTTPEGIALPGATVSLGGVEDVTNEDGTFRLERAVPGDLELSRPAWQSAEIPWDGVLDQVEITMEPLELRGIRVSGAAAGDTDAWSEVLSLANATAIDAVVLDIKDESGTVLHDTEVSKAHQIGAVKAYYDLPSVLADMEERDLYTIGRIVTFQDPPLARAEPDHAVVTESGSLWESSAGYHWLDPSDPAAYEYAVDLGEEACRRGFDEVQFDYVSYPLGPLGDATFDGEYTEEVRVASINAFLDRAYTVLNPMGCAVAANVLAITLESPADEGVGQRPGAMSRTVDVLSPMIYTTNYGAGWKGFEDPDEHAVEIVDGALGNGLRKLEGFGFYRPWLQTWTISAGEVRDVQSAVEARGLGWMLWSQESRYSADVLPTR